MRTYDRQTYQEASRQWEDFGPDWRWLREVSWQRGFPYPPTGSKHDDREVSQPSQRAVIWRALEDNPNRLRAIVLRSSSWSQVVDGIFGLEERLRREADELDADTAWERKDEPTSRQSLTAIGGFIERIAESLGFVRKDAA